MEKEQNNSWLVIKTKSKNVIIPSEIKINKDGHVYINGKPYDESQKEFRNLSINVDVHEKVNTGEETKKLIEAARKAKRGETKVIKDIKDDDKKEQTSVKF
ncbi:hypothetical protein [Halothermothrix orenii]|uniref:Uncharacterized protein n=1 Tax=Halothermothrix orenii (strain H 168 / OCM 544 / DSM 9562) TaxID=373903 RepID=B8CX73_HALOH|nr:hypothetical protein [Halothermothrix orenii]ACL69892.1 hypothetical protein Hore_11400 [Halothermothrix orenii H 168]